MNLSLASHFLISYISQKTCTKKLAKNLQEMAENLQIHASFPLSRKKTRKKTCKKLARNGQKPAKTRTINKLRSKKSIKYLLLTF